MTLPSSGASSSASRKDGGVTVCDSTGLAVQDLAVAVAVFERWRADPEADLFGGVTTLQTS